MDTREGRSLLVKVWPKFEQVNLALTQVYEGMCVYDRTGRKLGTVEAVYLGELAWPDAEDAQELMTGSVRKPREFSLIEDFARAISERVSDSLRERLLRHGFIRIDSLRPFALDHYAMPHQIDRVSDDRVMLRVQGNELIKA
jgi:hypothetical protein